MKAKICCIILIGLSLLITACAGGNGRGSVGVYHHHHIGPWWGGRSYYRDRVIVVPPERENIDPDFGVEAPPPSLEAMPHMDMPDMGMPDTMDMGDF